MRLVILIDWCDTNACVVCHKLTHLKSMTVRSSRHERYSLSSTFWGKIHFVVRSLRFDVMFVGRLRSNVETSYFTQLKMCYLMTTFRCPSDILITSWSTWPGNHLVPCVAELVRSCIPIHALRCLPDPKCLFYPSGLSLCLSVDRYLSCHLQELLQLLCWRDNAGSLVWGSRNTRKKWTLSQLVHGPEPPGQGRAV